MTTNAAALAAARLASENRLDKKVLGSYPSWFYGRCTVGPDCWTWNGYTNGYGYGVALIGRRSYRTEIMAHRLSYELNHGPIPAALTIDHLCRNRICVRPDHLEVVTRGENTRRAMVLITHCPAGHSYEEHGRIDMRTDGYVGRHCRECDRIRHAALPRVGCPECGVPQTHVGTHLRRRHGAVA